MAYIGLQSSIWSNRLKSFCLVILFPAFLFILLAAVFVGMTYYNDSALTQQSATAAIGQSLYILLMLMPVIIIRFVIAFYFQRRLIFKFSGARPLERKENPTIYNIVENLCISKGLNTPKIGIIDDDSMNAFATGRGDNAWIVFSKGLTQKLDRSEIEAVAAHELTHIINRDTLLMVVIILFVGIIGTLGEILFRIAPRIKGKKSGEAALIVFVLGIVLLVLGYLIFPLIRLAISRKREFLADAGSVELTKDKNAMISALTKISQDSTIESISKQTIAAMCIDTPFEKNSKTGKVSRRNDMLSTHPSIEKRIEALKGY